MSRKENIKNFSGWIIGIYEFMDNGDIAIREWPSQNILGFYRKAYDYTTNFVVEF